MSKTITIEIKDIDFLNDLERIFYEYESHKEVIYLCLMQEINPTNDTFKYYQNEFIEISKEYREKKEEFQKNFIKNEYPEAINWKVNFRDKTVDITI